VRLQGHDTASQWVGDGPDLGAFRVGGSLLVRARGHRDSVVGCPPWPVVGVLALARVDAAIFAVLLGVLHEPGSPCECPSLLRAPRRIGGASALLFSPWLCYNLFLTGSPDPSVRIVARRRLRHWNAERQAPQRCRSLAQNAFPSILAELNKPLALGLLSSRPPMRSGWRCAAISATVTRRQMDDSFTVVANG